MSSVRTILGDIDPHELGVCYAHEHVVIDDSYSTEKNPEYQLNDVEKLVAELRDFRSAGGRAMVDSMPGGGAGRNVLKLAKVSRDSGVHVLCPTGLHLAKYYPPGHWGQRLSEDELAEIFVGEIVEGIDGNDLAGPTIERSGHRAGLIKVASGKDRLDEPQRRLFRAAAKAQRATGAPILTHAEQGTAAMEQIEVLASAGTDVRHVVLSHTDRQADVEYHRAILRTGVKVEYDSGFRWKAGEGNPTLDLCVALLPEFPTQIMLGMDAARTKYWKQFGGGPGLTFLLAEFVPRMRAAGLSQVLLDRVFVHNPAETFQFIDGRK